MTHNIKYIIVAIILSITSACSIPFTSWEQPTYTVLKKDGDFELREYDPYIIAEVEVKNKNNDDATSEGFRILADYIFGNNTTQTEIAMTSPVRVEESEEIAMTSPVKVDRDMRNDIWRVSFVLPSKWTLATVPLPNNNRITLKEMPQENIIAVRFSWFMSEEKIEKYEIELTNWARRNRFEVITPVMTAIYDPPFWTLPFLRRNEVLLGVM